MVFFYDLLNEPLDFIKCWDLVDIYLLLKKDCTVGWVGWSDSSSLACKKELGLNKTNNI
jgi:hypothetical protein